MRLLLVMLLSSSYTTVESTYGGNTAPENIARMFLQELCPEADVCYGNQTTNGVQQIVSQLEKTSCCTDCSCESDCEENGDCCFLSDFKAKLGNNSDNVCLFPMHPQPRENSKRYFQSYSMVSDVQLTSNHGTVNVKCGDIKVAPWGSLFPVFSKKTGIIYKNSACADADNVTDGELWDFVLSCRHTSDVDKTTDAATYISSLYLSPLPENCKIDFIYPGEIMDLKSKMCFSELISTCSETEFHIPENLPLTRQQIREVCTSGLFSPYRHNQLYINVFCYICNDMPFLKSTKCTILNGRFTQDSMLDILLNGRSVSDDFYKPDKQSHSDIPKMCPIISRNKQDLCRIMQCPSGQLRHMNGECIFPVKQWYMKRFEINIKLTADKPFDVDESLKNTFRYNLSSILDLTQKWPKNWFVSSASKERNDEKLLDCLFLKMINSSPIKDPKLLLNNIKSLLYIPWTLRLSNGTIISMHAEFSHFTERFHNNHETGTATVIFPNYEYLYTSYKSINYKSTTAITRLYFCDQIELNTSEYELYSDKAIYNKFTNRTLYIGEFTKVFSADAGTAIPATGVRICIDDSGFIKMENSSPCIFSLEILLSCIVIVIILNKYRGTN